MLKVNKERLAYLFLLIILFLSSGCTNRTIPVTEQATAVQPTILVTVFITQVVVTGEPPAPTAIPSPTPIPTNTPIWDPLRVPIYYPIMNCSASRLHVGDRAFVAYGGGTIGLHPGSDVHESPPLEFPQLGEVMEIIGGPKCSRGWIVWQVQFSEERIGWMAEGNGEEYYLLPMPPQATKK